MAEIVNLRRVRKAKLRDAAQKESETNRTKHGTPKAARVVSKAKAERAMRLLDAHKIDK
jgi:hypothetical protein